MARTGRRPAPAGDDETTPAAATTSTAATPKAGSRLGATWIGLAAFTVVLILLVIFILQNQDKVTLHFLGASGHAALGILVLIGAIAGVVLTLLLGTLRIVQLRVRQRRDGRHG